MSDRKSNSDSIGALPRLRSGRNGFRHFSLRQCGVHKPPVLFVNCESKTSPQQLRRHRTWRKAHSYRARITPVPYRYHTGITLASTLAAISTRGLYCHAPPVCLWHATPSFCHSSAAAAAATTNSTSLNTPVSRYSLFAKFTAAATTSLARTSAKYEIHGIEPGVI